MKLLSLEIEPGEIDIDKRAICNLLGIDPVNIPEPYDEIIQRELEQISLYKNIKGGYLISENIDTVSSNGRFIFENIEFKAGKQVVHDLKKSEMLALFVCTAGEEVSSRSRNQMKSGDMLEGYITDMTGSLLAEGAMDVIFNHLSYEMRQQGLNVTNRYSPGYCNWKVDEQKKLFSFFPDNFCGISLTQSSLMIPVKSVSGVIGIGREVAFNKYSCDTCNDKHCLYRNIKFRE